MKEKETSELENYEKDYLSRLEGKKSTKSLERKKPAAKKTKKKVSKKSTDTKTKKPRKSDKKKDMNYDDDDTGIVLIDDDLEVDEQAELEERKAYLEEARSQDSSD
ncbi:uncharacterized protein METZ01_LOCUS164471 [marine metagenome]|uniref:Uncharacterized protein n=1 Tax=marine metagenome TaxID=408172 RepID=A0A382BEM0_9ZZZZ